MPKLEITETIVIYHSHEDGGWIAHGLRTDQIGISRTPVDALAQCIRLIHVLLDEAETDPSLLVHREAPYEIQEMVNNSKSLPKEIAEVAHWKAFGQWPEEWQVQPPAGDDSSFVVDVGELSIA